MMRQYGLASPPTTTTWMSSRRNIWIISSGAALSGSSTSPREAPLVAESLRASPCSMQDFVLSKVVGQELAHDLVPECVPVRIVRRCDLIAQICLLL